MKAEEIATILREFIRKEFGVPEPDAEFNDEVDLFAYGYVDSFGAVTLSSFIEKRFAIQFTGSDWMNFPMSNIIQISAFVAERQKGEL